jgi:hypothetical protein
VRIKHRTKEMIYKQNSTTPSSANQLCVLLSELKPWKRYFMSSLQLFKERNDLFIEWGGYNLN